LFALADILMLSPVCKINFPVNNVTASATGNGVAVMILVGFPDLTWSDETVIVDAPILLTCASNTTVEYPVGAVYIDVLLVVTFAVIVLNMFSACAMI
jgi:hypothetical protein